MRKYIIGISIGAALTFTGQAFAATLLGSTVDAVIQVEVDGQNMGQAPVIDGVSYLPVRQFGNEAGYNVAFGEGKATLTSEETTAVGSQEEAATETPTTSTMSVEDAENIKSSEDQIVLAKDRITERQAKISGYEADLKTEEEKLSKASNDLDKQTIQSTISGINNMIKSAKESNKMDEDGIVAQRASIDKIKAKYQP